MFARNVTLRVKPNHVKDVASKFENEISIQMQWVKNELKQIAPQVLVATR